MVLQTPCYRFRRYYIRMGPRRVAVIVILLCLVFYFLLSRKTGVSQIEQTATETKNVEPKQLVDTTEITKPEIALALTVCGDRLSEALVMIKSALFFTNQPFKVYIMTEEQHKLSFQQKLSDWRTITKRNFSYEIRDVIFPEGEKDEWRVLFKQCSAQRLFLPDILTHVDSVLWVDTDTLFLGPITQVWDFFKQMNASQLAAVAPEHEDPNVGWYNRFAKHPYYKPLGINTGVMLMNLTRMRQFAWKQYIVPIYKKYKNRIPWGDQDIINILFHYFPDKLFIFSCRYNFRADHCMYTSVCKEAETYGIVILHGSRGIFHSEKHPPFRDVYRAMEEYEWDKDGYYDFYLVVKSYVAAASTTNCGGLKTAFLKNIELHLNKTVSIHIPR